MQFAITTFIMIISVFCLISGIYILFLNNNNLNKLSFLICISLACYCFATTKILTADTILEAMSWRKICGVSAFLGFAFLLDFVLSISLSISLKKNWWIKILIYSPAIIFCYKIVLYQDLTGQMFPFLKGDLGWIVIPGTSIWFYFFNIYIFVSLLLGFGCLLHWKINHEKMIKESKGNKGKSKKDLVAKQAEMMMCSYVLSSVLFLICQSIFYFVKNPYIYLVTPMLIPIPLGFILVAVTKYQFLQEKYIDIIMEQFRTRLSKYLSLAYLAGSVIYFITQYFGVSVRDGFKLYSITLVLFVFSITIYISQKMEIKKEILLFLYAIIVTATIPIVTLNFASTSAVTVWTFPFVIIISCVLLDSPEIFVMVTTTTIITQIYLWICNRPEKIILDETDFFGRILIFGIAALLVSYINKIYIKRLQQLTTNTKDHDLLFRISTSMLDLDKYNKSEKMLEIMEVLGKSMKAERVFVYYSSKDENEKLPEYFAWDKHNEKPRVLEEERDLYENVWWKQEVRSKSYVKILDVSELPVNASEEKRILSNQKTEAMVAVPIVGNSIKNGFIRLDYTRKNSVDCEDVVQTLSTIGTIIGKAEDKHKVELEIENMAHYDQLTQIPNRSLFGNYITQWIHYSMRNNNSFGILFLDIDSFKHINDISGHNFGDAVIVKVAERIQNCLRKADIIGRFGGDEFIIMIHHIKNILDIEKVAAKIIDQFKEPIIIEENELNITVSIGISIYPNDGNDKESLIKNADIAMYKAKEEGKNKFVCCSEQMKTELTQEITITNLLYKALERDEFELVYQPQIHTNSCKIIATEALLRWNNPVLGTLSPGVFIPLAEKTGLIVSIGEWVLFQACKQNKMWQDAGYPRIRVAVNVSVNQLLTGDFPQKVKMILEETRLEAKYLEIEITENVAMQEMEIIIKSLLELKEIGVSIAIDDFGVEYSSLTRIKDLPIDRIKLDMQFIKNILISEKERKITDAIIHLAKNLNLIIIAEGVEKEEQFLYLKERNCDEIQGYYFYKPLSVDDMEKELNKVRIEWRNHGRNHKK